MRSLFALIVIAGCGAPPPTHARYTPIVVETPSAIAAPRPAPIAQPITTPKAPRVCVSFPAGDRPKLLESISTGFGCGVCMSDPDCRARDEEGRKPVWNALLAAPQTREIHVANGSFGEPGADHTRGPAWQMYFAFTSPPPIETRDTWTVGADGPNIFVMQGYEQLGGFVVEAMIFQDEMPNGGTKEVTMTACDGAILFHDQIDFVPHEAM